MPFELYFYSVFIADKFFFDISLLGERSAVFFHRGALLFVKQSAKFTCTASTLYSFPRSTLSHSPLFPLVADQALFYAFVKGVLRVESAAA